MLFEVSEGDLTKFAALRKVKKELLYKVFYNKRLEKLNELIGVVSMLKKED